MRQMELQIQQLERSSEAEIKAEVERQVAAHVDAAMGRLKAGINFSIILSMSTVTTFIIFHLISIVSCQDI